MSQVIKYGLIATDDNQIYWAVEIDGKVILLPQATAITSGTWIDKPIEITK